MKRRLKMGSGLQTTVILIAALAIIVAIVLVIGALGGVWSLLDGPQAALDDGASTTTVGGPSGTAREDTPANALEEPPVQIRIRSPEAAPGLSNDSAGPLFVEENMAPGATTSRCVSVTNVGVQLGDVRFFGFVQDEGLARHISFTIEAGTGRAAPNCSGFKGTTIYRGTLADLATDHTSFATGVKTKELLYPNEAMSFRLTQQLDTSSPQGVKARARFDWEARGAGAPSPLREGRDPLSYQARSPEAAEDDASTERSIPEVVLDVAVGVAKRGWTWGLLLGLVVLFLIVQDQIDRRDPRLARAQVRPEADLEFTDGVELTHHRTEADR